MTLAPRRTRKGLSAMSTSGILAVALILATLAFLAWHLNAAVQAGRWP